MMKSPLTRFLLTLFLAVTLGGCDQGERSLVYTAAEEELNRLKNIDQEWFRQYKAYEGLFPDAAQDEALSNEIAEVFSLFFQDFSYRLGKPEIWEEEGRALVAVHASVKDGTALARDYAKAQIREELVRSAAGADLTLTDKDRYGILAELLEEGSYPSERDFSLELRRSEERWHAVSSVNLENELMGGFPGAVSDTFLLGPDETLSAWLDGICSLDTDQLGSLLGLSGLSAQLDPTLSPVVSALTQEIQDCFDYEILSYEQKGFHASVEVRITSLSFAAIQEAFDKSLTSYLGTAESVIAGEEARYEKACQLLLSSILDNKLTSEATYTIEMVHDGTGWGFQEEDFNFGSTMLGILPGSLVSMEQIPVS